LQRYRVGFQSLADFIHDGLFLSPLEYASLLMKLADEGKASNRLFETVDGIANK